MEYQYQSRAECGDGITNKLVACEYMDNIEDDNIVLVRIYALVAIRMAQMHKVKLPQEVKTEPIVWDKIEQILRLIPETFSNSTKQTRFAKKFGSKTRLWIEYERLKSHLMRTESPLVFAHNDLLLRNVIYNDCQGIVSFIDYEYAAYNYQAYDIANHFNEFVGLSIDNIDYAIYPSEEFQKSWIRTYLMEYLTVTNRNGHGDI
ncbi:unnamed protein product [Leptidea sinapis]|uniref:ethanolamine kinase n=1 Tax=Leptidea sinapis TaxID=189913 RepID=A0A5E4R596_9NEOP|nr:unnamed protein product [Leptidea sinapis]